MSKTRVHDMILVFGGMVLTVVLVLVDSGCSIADAITAGLALTAVLVLMDMREDHNVTENHTR